MPFTLVQLETFRTLARLGNFTRTAEALFLTQSAVTQQIKSLQKQLRVPLFDLVGRRPVLTDAGRFLAERAGEIGGAVTALEHDMREFAAARSGTLELGATVTVGNYALPPLLSAFRERAPGTRIALTIANTAAICQAVHAGNVALALVEGNIRDAQLVAEIYDRDELVLIVPPAKHRLSTRRTVVLQDLSGEELIIREPGSGTRMAVDELLRRDGSEPNAALVFSSNEGIVRAVENGLGIALISRLCIDRAVAEERVRLITIRDADLRRSFRIVRARGRTLSPLADDFVAFLRQRSGVAAPAPTR